MKRNSQSWRVGRSNASVVVAVLLVALLVLTVQIAQAQVVDRSTMMDKVMCGYQGWFACPGDGNDPAMGWGHWSGNLDIGVGNYHCDIWPDVTEYDASDLFFVPNTLLTYGGTPYLFSPFRPGPVNTHFRWMQENGIDGAFLQRFIIEVGNPASPTQIHRDTVLQNVMNASTTYGRTFAVEYDITGAGPAGIYNALVNDWSYLNTTYNVKNHSRYQYHNGKPVVIIWGVKLDNEPSTLAAIQQVIDWFKANGCFIMAGVGGDWRTDATWATVYRNFDGITPWTVGGYNSWAGIDYYKTNSVVPDLAECNSLGKLYMTTAWPRFQWDNMHGFPCGTSYFDPRGGQHLWDQVYAFKSAGVPCQFIAMFDEYDEGTAIMKCSDNKPVTSCWLTTNGLGNDWFLRLANQAGRMQRGEIAVSQTIPINSGTSPDNSQIMSNTVPATMTAGQPYSVSIVVRNIGETYWNATQFKLGVGGDYDPFYTSSTRVLMSAGEMIAPNAEKTFTFTMTAPTTNGTYKSDWQMVHEAVRWFGQGLSKQIRVGGTDTTAPAVVTNMVASAADRQVTLTWKNPTTADYTGTMIRFKTTGYPSSVTDGTLVCDRTTIPGANDSYVHAGLTNGVTYYYGVWTYDYAPNYSARVTVSGVPVNITAPGPAQNFVANANGGANALSWTNPTDIDFAGMRVVFKTTGYPTSPTDGTVAYSGTGTGFSHTGLTNGTVYYYAAYSFDAVPNYSTAAKAATAPVVGACFADGFPYADGNLVGNNGWTGAATSQIQVVTQTAKINGAAGAWELWRNVSCAANPQGIIWVTAKIQSGVGAENMWSIWLDDAAGMNLARWYGAGTTARGRIGVTSNVTATQTLTGGWDTLKVKIDTVANTTEFFFNNVSLGALDHSVTGAGNSVARIRLQRLDNANTTGNYVYFDDLATGDLDVTAPGPVTSFVAIPGDTQNVLSWVNPGSDYTGTMVRFSTVAYPGSPTGGTLCYNGNGTGYTHTGLTNGVTYYYTAYAYDGVPNYSTPALASAIPSPPVAACFSDAFPYADGNLNGNGSWSGSATSQIQILGQNVRINGGATSYDAIRAVSCGDPGVGYMTVTFNIKASTGAETMWNLWIDDPSNVNLARWYGSGTTARGRIGTSGTVTATQTLTGVWDTLKVNINPVANTSEFFFNGVSMGVLNHTSAPGNTIGRLRFERENNSAAAGNYLYFDNLVINPDSTPPGNVTSFTATPGDAQNSLSWANPGDSDLAGVKIMFKTTGYPTGPTDGTQCFDGTGTSTTHTGLTNGTTYYYKAFAYDTSHNYASGAQASAMPVAGFCFRDQFTYANGALNGNGGWSGSATSAHIAISGSTVKITGGSSSKDAIRTVSCSTGSQTYIWVRCQIQKGSGGSTIWDLYINDATGANFARWYGSGTTARGRISGSGLVTAVQTLTGGWDNIDVKIVPSTQTAEFFFNGTSLGSLSYSGYATGSTIGQLRFERENNNVPSEYVFLDDLRVGG